MASAEAEVAKDPERFLRTFYDRWDMASEVRSPEHFLIVGPKGVGKSAIGEYIRLSLEKTWGEHAIFSRILNLDEVSPGISPISAITQKLASDQSAGITDSAWRLFLALRFLDMLIQDQSCNLSSDDRVRRAVEELKHTGLTEGDFPTILRRVRENKISVSLKGVGGADRTVKDTDEVSVSNLGSMLIKIIVEAQTQNHFLLTIDGLDRIIGDNPAYWGTLAALLRVSDDLHKLFKSADADLRILVMCRSDVFRKINFADSDKIAGDSALFVDWGAHQTIPSESHLWDYIVAKAEITTDKLFDLLPKSVTVGERGGTPRGIKIADYLLQFTRSTPRELTLLLKRLQKEIPPGGYATSNRVRMAADNFASRDLLTIVNAEATGTLKKELQDHLDDVISHLPAAADVRRGDLVDAMKTSGGDPALVGELSEFLFMAGLLGNYDPATGHVQFYHRRDTYKFKREGPWVLHRGLMYAFNVNYTRKSTNNQSN